MGGSKFIPIVIAGLVGLFIGWLAGPDVGSVEDSLDDRVSSLQETMATQQEAIAQQVAALQAEIQELSASVTAPAEGEDAGQAATEAVANLQSQFETAIGQLTERSSALSTTVQEQIQQAATTLGERFDAIEQNVASLGQAPSGGEGEGAGDLVSQIDANGAILLPEQGAIFGGTQVNLISVSEDSATVAVGDGEEQEVSAGDSVDLSDGCAVTLAGVSGGAAYFASEGCSGAAAGSGDEAAAGGQDQQAAAVAGTATASSSEPEASEQQAAAGAAGGGEGTPVGGTASFGDRRIFVSSIRDDQVSLFAAGGSGRETVAVGSSYDAGDGCMITVDSVADGRAVLSSEGCEGGAAASGGEQQGQNESAEGEEQQAAAAAPAAEGGEGSGEGTPIGGTAVFGERRFFVSAVRENEVLLFPAGGSDRETVAVGSSLDAGDGCMVSVDSVDGNRAVLSSEGCEGGAAGTEQSGSNGEQPEAEQQGQNTQQPAASSGEEAESAEVPGLVEPAAEETSQAASAPGGDGGDAQGLSTGQTVSFGETRVFVSALSDNAATLYVVGAGREQVEPGSAVDAGNGCSVTLERVEGGQAFLSAAGC